MVGVFRDPGMRFVNRRYLVARRILFGVLWRPVTTSLFEAGWRMQIEYDGYYGSTLSRVKR
jgi:hypothetical protein